MHKQADRSRVEVALGVTVSLAALAALLWLIDPAQIWQALRQAQAGYVGLGLLGMLVYMWLRAVRWRYMLNQGPSVAQVFHTQNIGYMLTQILPFRLGDVARGMLIGNLPGLNVAQGLSTMVVERLLDMLLIVLVLPFSVAGLAQLPDWMREYARLSGVAALGILAVVALAANLRPKTLQLAARLLKPLSADARAVWLARLDKLLLALTFFTQWRAGLSLGVLSLLTWLPIFLAYQAMLRAVGLPATLLMAVFTTCAGALSIAAPSSPSGVGVFHAGVTIALVQVLGQAQAQAAAFAFLYHGVNVLFLLLLGQWGLIHTEVTFSQVVGRTRQFMTRSTASQVADNTYTQTAAGEPHGQVGHGESKSL